jgi:hypothetical protein
MSARMRRVSRLLSTIARSRALASSCSFVYVYLFRDLDGVPRYVGKGTGIRASDDPSDEIRFQEAHGARLFRQGKPRAILEVKSPHIPTAIYEARLRGYDEAKERSSSKGKAKAKRGG